MPKPTIFEILDRYQIDPMDVRQVGDNGFDIRITFIEGGKERTLLVTYMQRRSL